MTLDQVDDKKPGIDTMGSFCFDSCKRLYTVLITGVTGNSIIVFVRTKWGAAEAMFGIGGISTVPVSTASGWAMEEGGGLIGDQIGTVYCWP